MGKNNFGNNKEFSFFKPLNNEPVFTKTLMSDNTAIPLARVIHWAHSFIHSFVQCSLKLLLRISTVQDDGEYNSKQNKNPSGITLDDFISLYFTESPQYFCKKGVIISIS